MEHSAAFMISLKNQKSCLNPIKQSREITYFKGTILCLIYVTIYTFIVTKLFCGKMVFLC